ncbi:mucin-22-like isoform X2 [Pecten maximus]|uniref:mucin-22-like isoform X2 n=1 Tax=Pecten maximus TaxID=6579 RepID=UPI0014590246|nr:mucin-22-like isoform X2 [Pecten maximus]
MWITDLDSEELCPEDTGHGSFNQSNIVTDSDMNQSDTALHSKVDQSKSHSESVVSQKDQSLPGLRSETHSTLNHSTPTELSCSAGLVLKTEPVDISEISSESTSALTFQHRESIPDVVSETNTGEDKDSLTVATESESTEKEISPTTVTLSTSRSTVSQPTESQSTSHESISSQSTVSQSTASHSTASESLETSTTGSQSTASGSLLTGTSGSQSTASQSLEISTTGSQSTANQSLLTGTTASQSTASQALETSTTGSQSTDSETLDRKPELTGQAVKLPVKEEPVNECQVEEDPFQQCENNLLQHIFRVQGQIDLRLDMIEEQVSALEAAETGRGDNSCTTVQNTLTELPTLKKSFHMLQSDLVKVKRMSAYHR